MVKADEGKQKQLAECVDNTGATQLSKLSDINLSCAPEQDLGLKSLQTLLLTQNSCLNHCHLQCGHGMSLPTGQELRRLTEFFFMVS